MILWYTGTGNSRYLAEELAGLTRDDCFTANFAIKRGEIERFEKKQKLCEIIRSSDPFYLEGDEKSLEKAVADDNYKPERLIFVAPIYGWRPARVFQRFLLQLQGLEGVPAYFVLNAGQSFGAAEEYCRKICEENKMLYKGTATILMPENYVILFKVPEDEESAEIIAAADRQISETAAKIKAGESLIPDPALTKHKFFYSKIVNSIFFALIVKSRAFKTNSKCIKCGRCAKLCPLANIEMTEDGPVWGKNCTHCCACICLCPTEAIEYGCLTQGKKRYRVFEDKFKL